MLQHDRSTVQDREDRCTAVRSLMDLPVDPENVAGLAESIKAGRWKEVRAYLYENVPEPDHLRPDERARVRQERLSVGLYEPARRGDVEEIRRLLRLGANPNITVEYDDMASPLAWAALCNHAAAVRVLLDGGVDPDQQFWWGHGNSYEGGTAIFFAARFGSADAMRLLIQRGADVNAVMRAKDRDGHPTGESRPLDWAETSEVRGILEQSGGKHSAAATFR